MNNQESQLIHRGRKYWIPAFHANLVLQSATEVHREAEGEGVVFPLDCQHYEKNLGHYDYDSVRKKMNNYFADENPFNVGLVHRSYLTVSAEHRGRPNIDRGLCHVSL